MSFGMTATVILKIIGSYKIKCMILLILLISILEDQLGLNLLKAKTLLSTLYFIIWSNRSPELFYKNIISRIVQIIFKGLLLKKMDFIEL